MPRNPIGGFVMGIIGLVATAMGLVLAAWVAATLLDAAKGVELAAWALARWPFYLPWPPAEVTAWALDNLILFAIAAGVALLIGGSNLRAARIAFRPASQSHDGRGQLQLPAAAEPRVGRPFEGSVLLADGAVAGEEYDVVLSGGDAGARPAHRMEQKVRARQGAHAVSLPFRFDVPANAPGGFGSRWRLEFAPAGKRAFSRSWFPVKLADAPEDEVDAAHRPMMTDAPALTPATAAQHGYVDHVEKLYGAMGGKLTEAQRNLLREKLSGPGGESMQRQLQAFRKLTPQHVRMIKYAFFGFIALFFVLPFVMSVLGLVLAAIFGK